MRISCPVCLSLQRNTTAVGLAASLPWMMAISSSSKPAGFALVLHRPLMRACRLRNRSSPTPGVGLDGLVPRPVSAVLGGVPFAVSDFRDFRAHGPRMRIYYFSAPSATFVIRVSAAVATVDRRPGRGAIFPAADTAFASVFAVPSEGSTGSAEAPAAATAVTQHAPSPRSTSHGVDSAAITDPAAFAPRRLAARRLRLSLPPSGRIFTRTRRRTAAATGTAPPAVDYGFGLGGPPRPSARRANTPPRVPRPRPPLAVVTAPALAASRARTVPVPSGRDRTQSVGTPWLRLTPS